MTLDYSLNGVSFASLGLFVTASSGVLPGLALKEPVSYNWPDQHGEQVDLSRPRYQKRKIELKCVLKNASLPGFIDACLVLMTQLSKSGTQRLMFFPQPAKPFVYEVYSPDGLDIEKKWREQQMYGTFTLTLIEPNPVKWVLIGRGDTLADLQLSAPSPIQVFWGDGTVDNIVGDFVAAQKIYNTSSNNIYYVIVAGALETLTVSAVTGLTELWPRLY